MGDLLERRGIGVEAGAVPEPEPRGRAYLQTLLPTVIVAQAIADFEELLDRTQLLVDVWRARQRDAVRVQRLGQRLVVVRRAGEGDDVASLVCHHEAAALAPGP